MLREENDEISIQSNKEEEILIQQELEKIDEEINESIIQENQKESEENSEKILLITCKSAKVVGEGMSAFATFEIQLDTKLSGFPGEKLVVDRRYSDFHHLREKLLEKHLTVIIPPIPEKDWQLFSQSNEKFPKEFLNYRRRQLQNFLHCIANHPKLRECDEFKDFFKTSSREEKSNKSFTSIFSNILGGAKSSVKNLKTSISNIEEPDEWFTEKTKLINSFCEQLESIANYSNSICNHLLSVCTLFSSISKCSQNISQLKFDENQFSQNFSLFSQSCSEIVPNLSNSTAKQAIHFRDMLFFYVRYLNSAKVVLDNRRKVLLEYQNAEKAFESKKNSTNKVEVSKLENTYNEQKVIFEKFSEEVKNEISSFEKHYTSQIMDSIIKFGQFNKDMNNQSYDIFKQFLSKADI